MTVVKWFVNASPRYKLQHATGPLPTCARFIVQKIYKCSGDWFAIKSYAHHYRLIAHLVSNGA